jgi:hypothetical protein
VRDVVIDDRPGVSTSCGFGGKLAFGLDAGGSPRLNGHCPAPVQDAAIDLMMIEYWFFTTV